jgi:hypothetical protein
MISVLFSFLLSLPLLASLVTSIPYSEYILAPGSRKIRPTSVHRVNGTVESAASSHVATITLFGITTDLTRDECANHYLYLTCRSNSCLISIIEVFHHRIDLPYRVCSFVRIYEY